jgi:hypothetical protein
MGFGHQEDVYFLGIEKYFYFFYALGQLVCIPRRCVVHVNYFSNMLSTLTRGFMCVFICSSCFDNIVSNLVKESYIILFLCVVCCDCWRFNTISGCLAYVQLSFSFLCCCRAFFLFSRFICNMNSCCRSGRRKSYAYGFLVDFAASVASKMRFPTM